MTKMTLTKIFKKFLRDRDGMAAVEFAISAPMLLFGMLIMSDLGLAFNERMNLDQAVRAGAEYVMTGVSDEEALKTYVIAAATGAYADDPNEVEMSERPTVTTLKRCECPDAPGTAVSCTGSLCSSNLPPSIYYDLAAVKNYDAIILPSFDLDTEITIQVR